MAIRAPATWRVRIVRQAMVSVEADSASEALRLAEEKAYYLLQDSSWSEEYQVASCEPEPRITLIRYDDGS